MTRYKILCVFICAAAVIMTGCASGHKSKKYGLNDPFFKIKTAKKTKEEDPIKKIFAEIDDDNETFKRSPDWLKKSYSGLHLKKLNHIPQEEYPKYRDYVSKGEVYVIVHPGFYVFFDEDSLIPLDPPELVNGFPLYNRAERLLQKAPHLLGMKALREQERLLRDFLEFMSKEKKLVILVLPKNFETQQKIERVNGHDEYARYLNDMTNMAESIVYLESKTYDTGYINKNELEILIKFFETLNIKTIYFGGGYVGKCLDAFYSSVLDTFGYENMFFVPELASITPEEVVHEEVLTKNEKLNFNWVIKYFKRYFSESGREPKIKVLPLYKANANRASTLSSNSK